MIVRRRGFVRFWVLVSIILINININYDYNIKML